MAAHLFDVPMGAGKEVMYDNMDCSIALLRPMGISISTPTRRYPTTARFHSSPPANSTS
jgi:hypothetical protein